jgi:hypothetical protein
VGLLAEYNTPMPRADLLSLTPDDLAALTNRGTVKRAQRELDEAEVTGELDEAADGTVTAKWSDGATCTLPGGKTVSDARCTCPATELCRHAVRTVLAYQARNAVSATAVVDVSSAWTPGDIPDDELAKHFKPAALTLARTQFEKGLLVELVKGHKPTARFHDLACTLRFQVRGDPRYVYCDCAAPPPCGHVPLAVWAFRRLPADKDAGIVTTQERKLPVPTVALDAIDAALLECAEIGLTAAGNAWRDRLARLEADCRAAGLIWPAEVVLELIQQYEQYATHDARFDPDEFARLAGELLTRADAVRADTGAAPQLLVRGTPHDHWSDLGSARFIGLGCGVRVGRKSATVSAYLQDANSGSVVAVSRTFADPDPPGEPKPFWQLAETPALKDASFGQLGAGQLITSGGKRATDHHLVLGRVKAAVSPQNFAWESLRPPVLADSFAEVRARLGMLPPSALRPRRVAEDFHVCPVAAVEGMTFRPDTQCVEAVVLDAAGERAVLRHPFTSRGADGAERLLARLTAAPEGLRFVSGPVRLTGGELLIQPVALVWHEETRVAVQPWIDRAEGVAAPERPKEAAAPPDPLTAWLADLQARIGALFVTGLRRADAHISQSWKELEQRAGQLGLARLEAAVGKVSAGLAEKVASARWDARPTAAALLALAVLSRAAWEVG